MKIIILTLILILIIISGYFYLLGRQSRQQQPPSLVNAQLAACGEKPNCVCSEKQFDQKHYIQAIDYSQKPNITTDTLREIIADMQGQIVHQDDVTISATFSSSLFGFVDDMAIRLDANKQQIHVRSASRVGHSDGGINRRRIEAFRKRVKAQQM